MLLFLVFVLESFIHASTLKFTLVNATVSTSWNATAPQVVGVVIVGEKSNIWAAVGSTYTPTWGTSYTWTNAADADLQDVVIGFIDDRISEVIDAGDWDLWTFRSPEDSPVSHRVHFTGLDLVDFYGEVTVTTSGGSNSSCSSQTTSSSCNSISNCFWYDNLCYDESWLCNGYTCDTCSTADSCAHDPDINAAGGCVWNATSRTCEVPGTGNECSSFTTNTCDNQSSCAWYKNVCYPKSWLCSDLTCNSCPSSVSCTNDPDIVAAGGCKWDTSKSVCYNASASSCEKVCAEAAAGCKPACIVNIEGCPCLCDTTGCIYENPSLVSVGKKLDRSKAMEIMKPHLSRNRPE